MVCTLYGVQVALENPFDGEGMVRVLRVCVYVCVCVLASFV